MERDRVFDEVEFIAQQGFERPDYDPVDVLRGETQRKRLTVLSREVMHFDRILRMRMMLESDLMMGPTSDEGRQELDELAGIRKALRKRKVIERFVTNRKPRLESLVLDGQQIAVVHDFLASYPYPLDDTENLEGQMNHFSSSLISDYPVAPKVEEGRLGKFTARFGRQK